MTANDRIGPGTLKLVTVDGPDAVLADVELELLRRVGSADVRRVGSPSFLVYCDAEPSLVRDWIAPLLRDDASVLVADFERWSARGAAVDRRWLLRRGH